MNPIPVRVMVLDTWDEVAFEVPPSSLVSDLKAAALRRAGVTASPAGYQVKFRGGLVPEGETTVGDAGLVPNAALIVLSNRRRAVR
ncbi:MAG: hypothetical protein R2882_14410 [Gemmatimonadales bacterium]